jgi:GntR family transcriptional repressor for pyruvate dehydrogenase complex
MNLPSIRPAKLADAIADHFRQLILEGALRPGEKLLSERDLSTKLDVSRPSLRDAMDKLISEGLLSTDAQGGTYVSESVGRSLRDPLIDLLDTPEARVDVMEMRSVIEAAAAALAAERASDLDREHIGRRMQDMIKAHEKQDVEEIARTDAEFHLAIYEASHNMMMLHLMRSLESILRSNVYLNRKNLYEHRTERDSQLQEHQAIYEGILARDAERAREAAHVHMTTALKTQQDIHEAEKRLQASIRRLERGDLVAPQSRRARARP